MTPRQLSAYEKFQHWEDERQLAALSSAVRAAHHSDKDGFKKYIDDLTK